MKYQLKSGVALKPGVTLKDKPPTPPAKVYPVKMRHIADGDVENQKVTIAKKMNINNA